MPDSQRYKDGWSELFMITASKYAFWSTSSKARLSGRGYKCCTNFRDLSPPIRNENSKGDQRKLIRKNSVPLMSHTQQSPYALLPLTMADRLLRHGSEVILHCGHGILFQWFEIGQRNPLELTSVVNMGNTRNNASISCLTSFSPLVRLIGTSIDSSRSSRHHRRHSKVAKIA